MAQDQANIRLPDECTVAAAVPAPVSHEDDDDDNYIDDKTRLMMEVSAAKCRRRENADGAGPSCSRGAARIFHRNRGMKLRFQRLNPFRMRIFSSSKGMSQLRYPGIAMAGSPQH